MLILGRKPGETIILKVANLEPISITVLDNGKIGIHAPDEVKMLREELLKSSTG